MRRANWLKRLTRENHVGSDAISAEKATGVCCRSIYDETDALYGRKVKKRSDEGVVVVGREVLP